MDADGDGHARIAPRQFLEHVQIGSQIQSQAVVAFGHAHGEEAEFAELAVNRLIEGILARVAPVGGRPQPLLGEAAGEIDHGSRLGRELDRRVRAAVRRHRSS